MAHNHPLWAEQDTEAARKVIAKIHDTESLTPKERAFVNAVKILYGAGDKLSRDVAYSAAMGTMYRQYPDDLEVATLYALSLLGTVRSQDKGFRRQMQAGAIALDVYQKNPNHPGAAHFIIHAFDDPEHAILALPAARRYADIAPEAHHARHMPSHIFLQLGMWPEAAVSNESAWAASEAWVKRRGLSISLRDYHSLHWLHYVYLQQGRFRKAEELLSMMRQTMAESEYDSKFRPNYYANNYADMAAAFVVETERWDRATKLFAGLGTETAGKPDESEAGGPHAGHGQATKSSDTAAVITRTSNASRTLPVFVQGLAAARISAPEAETSIAQLRAIAKQSSDAADAGGRTAKILQIRELELAAVASASKKNYGEAIETMKKATALEQELPPPSGPPGLIKPSCELFGEILLVAGRPKEAGLQFAASLQRQPNRARSLLGAARAAAKTGDRPAAEAAYSNFLDQWKQADAGLPELQEARGYLQQARR
jgi:tetratricopeptide (TPR) repeat protein